MPEMKEEEEEEEEEANPTQWNVSLSRSGMMIVVRSSRLSVRRAYVECAVVSEHHMSIREPRPGHTKLCRGTSNVFVCCNSQERRKEAEVQKSVSRLKGEYIVQLFDGPLRDLPGQSKTGMTLSVTPVSRSTTTSEERRCEK